LEGKDYFMIQTGVSERAGVFPSFPPACPSWGRSAVWETGPFMWMIEALCLLKENHQC
jgi:hypothetical protein